MSQRPPSKRKLSEATNGGARSRLHTDDKAAGRRLPVDVEANILAMATCASMHRALVVFRAKSPLTYEIVIKQPHVLKRIVQCANEWQRKVGGIEPATNTTGKRVGGLQKNTKIWCRLRTNTGILYVVGTLPHCWYPLQYIDSYDGRPRQVGDAQAYVNVTDVDAAIVGFVDEDTDESDTEPADLEFHVSVTDMLPNVFAETAESAAALFAKVDAVRRRMANERNV